MRTISYGYTISAYGHDYDNGVITTEPTAEIDGIITYTCKWCKHQDTKTLGKLGDGEPYIEGSFQKKGWDAVNDLIKAFQRKRYHFHYPEWCQGHFLLLFYPG